MATINPPTAYTTTNTTLTFVNQPTSNENTKTILYFYSKIISNEVLYWTHIIGYIGLNGSVSIFGIIANSINVIVFIRQGVLRDSNTVSLLILSMSDFCSLVTLLWMAICFMLLHIRPPNLPFHPMDMLYLTGGRPHLMFVQITSWLSVYIAFERCMCVVFPFKVRRLFTAIRTLILLSSLVALIMFGGYLPYYLENYLAWVTIPGTNRSILITRVADNVRIKAGVVDIKVIFNTLVAQPACVFFVFVFTQITAFRVNVSRKWRQKTSSSSSKSNKEKTQKTDSNKGEDVNEPENSKSSDGEVKGKTEIGNREKRLAKMITVISSIFIACMIPNLIIIIVELLDRRIAPGRQFQNLFFFNYAFSFFLEGVNSSINIFVYYNMSTKYRCQFRKLFAMEG